MTDTNYPHRPYGRYFKGEARSARLGKALTDDAIRAIRADKRSMRVIGAEHGISAPMVHHIKHRRRWAHVEDMETCS